jgi:hypothetical protein
MPYSKEYLASEEGKEKRAQYQRERRAKNKDLENKKAREYQRTEKSVTYRKNYNMEHKEEQTQYLKEYRAKNKELVNQKQRKYRARKEAEYLAEKSA